MEVVCWPCRHDDHDSCVAQGTKVCFCPSCWIDDDKDEDLEEVPVEAAG